jgi:NAD(P)-dependent dehydrogenase (short-subunit alcohol dehydrogenase family)
MELTTVHTNGERPLDGRVAIVTGGARGIGHAIATRFVREGAKVMVSSLGEERDAEAVDTLNEQAKSHVAAYQRSDAANGAEVEALVRSCVEMFGRLDFVVANAGIDRGAPFLEMTDEIWDEVLATDLRGTFLIMRAGAREMVAEGHSGSIVAIASTNAFWVESNLASYNVAKAGVVALVRTAAIELAPYGVTVNAVGPGLIRTRLTAPTTEVPEHANWYRSQIPMGRFGEPADVAGAVSYLVSGSAAWVTGHHLIVDGGQTAGISLPLDAITQ